MGQLIRQHVHAMLGVLFSVCIILAACTPVTPAPLPPSTPTKPAERSPVVVLTMGSWRTQDIKQMSYILGKFTEKHPTIIIKFDPTNAPDYNDALSAQLNGHTAPDLFYLRSFATSRKLYEQKYLELLNDLPGLKENFASDMLAPWATDDGQPYGVPFIATSHGVYYNANLFIKLNQKIPTTWQELLATAKAIKAAGYIPFANATGEPWTMAELVFMNLAPNFVGGRDGRLDYLAGKRCFNDAHIIAAFQAVKDLAPFLPDGYDAIKYSDSQQLFLQGRAAMWMSGSWDIPFFESEKPAFAWSVFAVPPPAGQPGYVTFHLDAGMGLNAASKHKAEAKEFLQWMTAPEFGELLASQLPGFFPMHRQIMQLENGYANTFLALNLGRGTDVRFTWDKLMEGSPSAYDLVQDGAVAVVEGRQSPQQAADALQAGLAQWFEPAQRCGK